MMTRIVDLLRIIYELICYGVLYMLSNINTYIILHNTFQNYTSKWELRIFEPSGEVVVFTIIFWMLTLHSHSVAGLVKKHKVYRAISNSGEVPISILSVTGDPRFQENIIETTFG